MIQSVSRAFRVLEIVAEQPETPRGLGTLATRAELNAATCAHILGTLVELGYVEQTAKKGGYILGPAAHALSAGGPYRKDLVRRVEPFMVELASQFGETAVLAVLRNNLRLTLREVEGASIVRIRADVLREDDPCLSATGRVLLAGLDDIALEGFLQSAGVPGRRWPEARTGAGLRRAMEDIRQQGFAVAKRGEVVGAAFPVVERGKTVAALGLFLPKFRFVSPHKEKVLEALRTAALASGVSAAMTAADNSEH